MLLHKTLSCMSHARQELSAAAATSLLVGIHKTQHAKLCQTDTRATTVPLLLQAAPQYYVSNPLPPQTPCYAAYPGSTHAPPPPIR
jgi:hypothetical protein